MDINNTNRNMRFGVDQPTNGGDQYSKIKNVSSNSNSLFRFIKKAIIFILVLSVLFGLLYYSKNIFLDKAPYSSDSFHAIFLTNNQVYFGHIKEMSKDLLVLGGVYYLQFDNQDAQNNLTTPRFSLIKLGSEIHGPKEEMYINREHILFYEELKSDSQVVKSIISQESN